VRPREASKDVVLNALLQMNHTTCGGPLSVLIYTLPQPSHLGSQKTGDGPWQTRGNSVGRGGTNSAHDRPTEFERPNKPGTSSFKLEEFSNALVSGKQGKSAGRSTPSADRSVGNSASMSGHRLPSTDFGRWPTEFPNSRASRAPTLAGCRPNGKAEIGI
jgi:hypothetical protein